MKTIQEIKDHAVELYAALEKLSAEVERSGHGPEVKSSMSRDISESQYRIRAVLDQCAAVEGAAVRAPVTAFAVV